MDENWGQELHASLHIEHFPYMGKVIYHGHINLCTFIFYRWLVQETEISQWEENKNNASALAHGSSFSSYHILIRENFDPLWSKLS